jgi:hypothetical protein
LFEANRERMAGGLTVTDRKEGSDTSLDVQADRSYDAATPASRVIGSGVSRVSVALIFFGI